MRSSFFFTLEYTYSTEDAVAQSLQVQSNWN